MADPTNVTELNGIALCLLQHQLLDAKTLKASLSEARKYSMPFISFLINTNLLTSDIILQCVAKNFGLIIFDLTNFKMEWLEKCSIPKEVLHHHRIVPLNREATFLYIGMADPTQHDTISAINFYTGLAVRIMLVDETQLQKFIKTHYQSLPLSQGDNALPFFSITELEHNQEEPIIDLVDQLLQAAYKKNVSDIHIEPHEGTYRVRFRQDGNLQNAGSLPLSLATRVITRLKLMGQLDITEKRLPQDGRINYAKFHSDIRINACPTMGGEKIVLRLFNLSQLNLSLDLIGLLPAQLQLFLQILALPQGLILVTGPTGSGKSITLYSALNHLNHIEKNIITIEDPVEIALPGINQININATIGLNFAHVLRAILRQDPDIILLGEIRDVETARIALQAAQTGHLVLATLHTNSALDAFIRLQMMGTPIADLSHSITLIAAQRLVRVLCDRCKKNHEMNAENNRYHAHGCEYCYQGYKGRTGIFELIPFTSQIQNRLITGISSPHLLHEIKQQMGPLLWEAALEKVKNGVTDLQEVIRVLGPNQL